jgi:hypothetical protein
LGATVFGDEGLRELTQRFGELEILHLGEVNVTNAGVRSLANCPRLRSLSLFRTQVTDASVDTLVELKELKAVVLGGTQVTQAGIDRLHAALPNCRITWDKGEIGGNPAEATPSNNPPQSPEPPT